LQIHHANGLHRLSSRSSYVPCPELLGLWSVIPALCTTNRRTRPPPVERRRSGARPACSRADSKASASMRRCGEPSTVLLQSWGTVAVATTPASFYCSRRSRETFGLHHGVRT